MSEFVDNPPDVDGARSPRFCRELVGQEKAVAHFLRNLAEGKLHHACLLSGPKGVGKASFAHLAARFMLQTPDPVGAARRAARLEVPRAEELPGRQLEQGSHPDLMIVTRPWDAAKGRFKQAISVEEIRSVRSFFNLSAGMGGWRICIIDAADDMTANAANALLKTLEEPPSNSLFLLISHQPGRLLDTIRSRCMKIAFQPLQTAEIQKFLSTCGAGGGDGRSFAAIAHLSGGSIGRALRIHDTNALDVYSGMVKLLRQYPSIGTVELHEFAERLSRRNAEHLFEDWAGFFLHWVRQLVRFAAAGDRPAAVFEGEDAAFAAMSGDKPLEAWVDVWEKVSELVGNARRLNLDRRQTVLEGFRLLQTGV